MPPLLQLNLGFPSRLSRADAEASARSCSTKRTSPAATQDLTAVHTPVLVTPPESEAVGISATTMSDLW
jgi:hypothetical protein